MNEMKKNILGYTRETMQSASRLSYYLTGAGIVLLILLYFLKYSIPYNLVQIGAFVGFVVGAIIVGQFCAWIIRVLTEVFGNQPNKFNFFAGTFFTVSIVVLIANLFV